MKKTFFFVVMMLVGGASAVLAQVDATFQFMDKDGNVFADGARWVASEIEGNELEGIVIPSQLYVKKNADGDLLYAKVACIIEEMTDGSSVQCCFPANCMFFDQGVGAYENGPAQYVNSDFRTEWIPAYDDDYNALGGICKASFQLFACTKNPLISSFNEVAGPTIHVTFVYSPDGGSTNIGTAGSVKTADERWYDLQGRELLSAPRQGIYIHNGRKYVK